MKNDVVCYFLELVSIDSESGNERAIVDKLKKDLEELGWKPAETFATGIRKTVAWYLENKQWWQNIQNNKYRQERLGIG